MSGKRGDDSTEVERTSSEKALFRENGYAIDDENDDFNEVEEHAGMVGVG